MLRPMGTGAFHAAVEVHGKRGAHLCPTHVCALGMWGGGGGGAGEGSRTSSGQEQMQRVLVDSEESRRSMCMTFPAMKRSVAQNKSLIPRPAHEQPKALCQLDLPY